MDIRLDDRVAIVTGSARGIGKGVARILAENGARVAIADIDAKAGTETAAEMRRAGFDAVFIQTDVTSRDDSRQVVKSCLEHWGQVDILVNNAGHVTTAMVEDMSEAEWRRVIEVNLSGPFLCCQAVLPTMRKRSYGKIVNVSSIAAKRISYNGGASYTAAKEGLLGFTRHLAYEVAPFGINVNAICPGTTETDTETRVAPPGYLIERVRLIPRGRLATVDDTGQAILFLVSDLADYVCGAVLDVDGGSLLGWYGVGEYLARRRASDGDAPEVAD